MSLLKLKKMNNILYLIIVLLLYPIENCFSKDNNTVFNWNKTDRHMPAFVKDSIQNYFNSVGMEDYLFFVNGKGMIDDKNNIDGVYTFKRFSSHSSAHLMLIYHSDVYIVKSMNYGGVVAEICRYAYEKQMNDIIFKRICLDCFWFLANNYSERNNEDCFTNIDSIIVSTKNSRVPGIYDELIVKNNIVNDIPFYILTKELDEKETIMLFGLLGGFNVEK